MKTKISHSIRLFLLVLFLGYYGGTTLFYHFHQVGGRLICHSHPFLNRSGQQGQEPSHQHSGRDFLVIYQLDQLISEEPVSPPTLPDPLISGCFTFEADPSGLHSLFSGHDRQGRAPPLWFS